MEEVYKGIYRIGVPLPNNPLRELNAYLIRGQERDLLIDTGFRRVECRDALAQGLQELGSLQERRDVLATHLHSDHSGLADLFADPEGHVYMGRIDLDYKRRLLEQRISGDLRQDYLAAGFPPEVLKEALGDNPAITKALPSLTRQFTPLDPGDVLRVGDYALEVIPVPGHTPGNCMLWEANHGLMFTGDHVLFDISPNITSWQGVEDSLGDYLDSLRRVQHYPVRQAFPAHRKSGDYHQRIRDLLHHHEERLNEILAILSAFPHQCAYDIAGQMTWRIRSRDWASFPPVQKWFAVGECLAHLNYLEHRRAISREMENGLWRYTAQVREIAL